MCKDFILSRYQLVRARLAGADAVLLIAAVLTPGECRALTHEAHELGLEVLLEVHRREELDYVSDDVDVVGVNNRDLGTFHTDPARSLELADAFPGMSSAFLKAVCRLRLTSSSCIARTIRVSSLASPSCAAVIPAPHFVHSFSRLTYDRESVRPARSRQHP